MKKIYFFLVLVLLGNVAYTQLLTFEFAGIVGSEGTVNSNTNATGVLASTISRGSGVTASGNGDRYNSIAWTTSASVDLTDYVEFTITPQSLYLLNITNIVVSHQRSGTGPVSFVMRTSLDGYATNASNVTTIADVTTTQTTTFTFSSAINTTAAVVIRLYGYSSEGATGSWGPGDFAGNDIIVNGTATVIPVPTTTGLTPSTASEGGAGFSLTVNGTNFISGTSTVKWNGSNRTTTVVSSTELTATITAADISMAGSATVTVLNTGNPTASNGQTFTINPATSPLITLTPTALSGFTYVAGTGPSGVQPFSLTGANLTGFPGNIVVTSPANYEINDGNGWASTFNIPYTSATLTATNIDVRLKAGLAVGTYNGEFITVVGGGDSKNETVSGTVTLGVPVANAPTIFTATSFTADWAPGVSGVAVTNGYRLDVATANTFAGAVGAVLAGWSFEGGTSAANSGLPANIGSTIIGSGVTNVTFNSSGNGGLTARAEGWDNGNGTKYWEVNLTSTGYSGLMVSSKQRGSNSGPRDFKLQYKIGINGTYTDVSGGSITVADNYTEGVLTNLSLPVGCDNQPSIYLRWIMTSNISVNAGTVLSGGAGNIDDIVVNGASISTYLPGYQDLSITPTSLAVIVPGPGTYYYRVRATTGVVTSANSNIVTVVMNNQNTAAFRTAGSGNYNSNGSWEFNVSLPSYYAAASQVPTSTNDVTIQNGHIITLTGAAAANNLTLNPTGNIILGANNFVVNSTSGGTSTGYIQTNGTGTLTVNNITTPKTLPIGNTRYNPLIIDNGSGHNWTARVADGVTADPGFSTNKAVLLTWDITPSVNPPAGPADITFQFDEAATPTGQTGAGFNTGTSVRAWNRSTGVWLPVGSTSAVNTTVPNAATVKINGLSTFSPYALANIDGALPVRFTNVKACQQSTGIKVDWSNLTESLVANYKVERSADGQSFAALSTVNPTLNNGGKADYSFFDANPVNGVNFYRIQSLEADGQKLYSVIVRVDIRGGKTDIAIYPNPVSGNTVSFQATALPKGQYSIRVINAGGQAVFTKSLQHAGGAVTEALQLPATITAGIYSLQVSDGTMNTVRKFIIR